MNKYLQIFLLFTVLCMLPVKGQNIVAFDHLDSESGLSQNDVNSIYQDAHGFMWFATHDGLNKYDGYDFTVFTPDPNDPNSISSNLIFAITGDDAGNLWIGTTGYGLNFFDASSERFIRFEHDKDNFKTISSDHISDLFIDKANRLWITTNSGISMLDLNETDAPREFQRYYPKSFDNFDKPINTIFQDSKGGIWAGGASDLFKLTRNINGEFYFKSMNAIIGLSQVNIRSINEDKFGNLILATEDGIFKQVNRGSSISMDKVYEGVFTTLIVDSNNALWVGSDIGLWYFEISGIKNDDLILKNRFTYNANDRNGISKNVIKSLYFDDTGILWVGTNGGGINKFNPNRKDFRHYKKNLHPKSLSYDKIRSIFEDSYGTLWFGTEGGGLNRMVKEDGQSDYSNFEAFTSVLKPFAISEINDNGRKTLLIGVEDQPGLYKLDLNEGGEINNNDFEVISDIHNSVFCILVDSKECIWIGTYGGGFYRWKKKASGAYQKNYFIHNEDNPNTVSDNIIRNIIEDSSGNIWLGTGNGLTRIAAAEKYKDNPRFDVYRNIPGDQTSLSHNYILAMYEDELEQLWIGTFGGGLNLVSYDQEKESYSFQTYAERDGLPNNVIKGILEDSKNNLWISTNKGISKFNAKEGSFKNYDIHDGLQSNEFQELAALKRKNGEMIFGGVNGFNVFYPDYIQDGKVPPETVITKFSIFNKTIGVDEELNGRVLLNTSINNTAEIELRHKENNISFEFAALHYDAPKKNRFAYKLVGFDEEWIYTSSDKRFANYIGLGAGSYTLMVKSANNDGVWDISPVTLGLTITPPFWATPIAYILYLLIVIGLIWFFIKYRLIATREMHQLELEHLEKNKDNEIQNMKLEFFTNISHEFRTPLTLIKGPLDYLLRDGEKLDKGTLVSQYKIIKKNTDILMKLVNQILDFRKLNQGKMKLVVRKGNVDQFIREIGETFQFLARKKEIKFNIEIPENRIESWFDHDALEKIINNLLSNAFKFTPNKGTISIVVDEIEKVESSSQNGDFNGIQIDIIDSGNGIDVEMQKHVFERFYVAKGLKDQNGEGTGIGLAFVKSLVDLHQGSISFESRIGEGTKFTVQLPSVKEAYEGVEGITCKAENDPDFLQRTSEMDSFAIAVNDEIEDKNIIRSKSNKPTLLVVDDNEDIRLFIRQILEQTYVVYEAENGKEGFDLAMEVVPNLIITDVLMPIMDGLELCEKLKSTNETSHIPVIMLTAKNTDKNEKLGRMTGADAYIRKPFDIELLRIQIDNILKNRAQMRKRFNRDVNLQPAEVTVNSTDELFLQQAMEIVEKNMMNTEFNVEMLVKEMGYSRSNLYLKFKEITGLSSSEFIRNVRLKRAVQLFEKSNYSVKEIMYMTGFNTASYFAKCFKKQFGVVPSEYVKKLDEEKVDK